VAGRLPLPGSLRGDLELTLPATTRVWNTVVRLVDKPSGG